MIKEAVRFHLHKNDWGRTVTMDTIGIEVTEFDISETKIQALLENDPAKPGTDRPKY